MEKVAVVGCGAYKNSGYGCPGRSAAPNLGMAMKLSEIKPDKIYLSSCLVNAKPGCPYASADEMANILAGKTGIRVVQGTHAVH